MNLKVSRSGASVVGELCAGNNGDVAAPGKELHDFCAAASHCGPTRLGLRILFERAIGNAVQFEVNLSQAAPGSAADQIRFAFEGNFLCTVNKRLAPDGEKGGIQCGGALRCYHARNSS